MLNRHKLYDTFKDGETVYVKSKAELELLLLNHSCKEEYKINYLNFAGVETKIKHSFYQCCTLDADKQFTWSYDWIYKKPKKHFEDDLFEL